jgi:hypothetical protein
MQYARKDYDMSELSFSAWLDEQLCNMDLAFMKRLNVADGELYRKITNLYIMEGYGQLTPAGERYVREEVAKVFELLK